MKNELDAMDNNKPQTNETMKRYGVTMTMTLSGYVVVEADSKTAAEELVFNNMSKYASTDRFSHAETTVDYADETNDECTELVDDLRKG